MATDASDTDEMEGDAMARRWLRTVASSPVRYSIIAAAAQFESAIQTQEGGDYSDG